MHAKRPIIAISQVRWSMDWWKSLSPEAKAHLRRHNKLTDAGAIARYWLSAIATVEESIAIHRERYHGTK